MMNGRVIKSTGSWYTVLMENDQQVQAKLKGKFKLEDKKVSNPIAVGDLVTVELASSTVETSVITDIRPRTNYVVRKSPKKTGFTHIIAANIDQAVLIASHRSPRTSLGFIDRFLVSAESFGITGAIIYNKVDLLKAKDREAVDKHTLMYEALGYPVLQTSVTELTGIEQVRGLLHGKISLFSGHSGVGKSSLLNVLVPSANQSIDSISDFSDKGKHTTTFAEMFRLDPSSWIIDTPGIKEFGIVELEPAELGLYFPEMKQLLDKCKYYNCQHIHEPGCAVLAAVQKGEIPESRYESYLSMVTDEDNRR